MKVLVLTTTLIALATGSAFAADLAPAHKSAPAAAAPFGWTGFYVGAHVGASWGTKEWDLQSLLIGAGPAFATPDETGSHAVNGMLGGVQGGYNMQLGWLVLGVEAEFSWAGLNGHGPCFSDVQVDVAYNCKAEVRALGTLAGRLGAVVNQSMIYVKGGAAMARDTFSFTSTSIAGGPPTFAGPKASIDDTRWGWMLGMGVEQAFTSNWSAKIEYNYLDFGTKSYGLGAGPNAFDGAVSSTYTTDIAQRLHVIKVGLNYRFDQGAVVAKY